MEYVNALVGDIMKIAQPGSEIGSRLHLSLVMSYGHVPEDNDPNLPVSTTKDEKKSDLLMLFPCQSYTMRGENQREDASFPHIDYPMAVWCNPQGYGRDVFL
ncbi:hypothetical protein I3843_15G034600 [Carya illinoinensis]|nr:hypothetical protein I3843_15G034600 [Carya illinoinensis]